MDAAEAAAQRLTRTLQPTTSAPEGDELGRPSAPSGRAARPAWKRAISSSGVLALSAFLLGGCHRFGFPEVAPGYREFAYVSNGAANTVSVLDLVYLRQDRTLQVGQNPTGLAVNPKRNEVYAVNTRSGSVSVINTETNTVIATIGVGRQPYFISVDNDGKRAYVANSDSHTVSVLDLDQRRELTTMYAGDQPGLARIAPDGRSLVVTDRGSGSVFIFAVSTANGVPPLRLRASFRGCAGATDVAILPDSSKAFAACSGGHQVMAVSLAVPPNSWAAKHNPSLTSDHLLTLLDVGKTPVHLTVKPDGGEVFVANFDSNTISAISTWTNEVENTYPIGNRPVYSVVSADNGSLWVSNFSAESVSLYSIDDGKMATSIHTGPGPDALAFSADEHLLLAADARSGDVAVIRTQSKAGPELFTMLPAGAAPNDIVVKAFRLAQ